MGDEATSIEPSVDDAYALDARKRFFARPETERAYAAWRFERTTSLTRMYAIGSAVFWATAAVLMVAFDLRTAGLLGAGVMGPTLGCLYVVIQRRSARWTARLWRFSVAVSGLLGVVLGAFFLGSGLHGAVVAGVVLACFWHLSGANEQPVHTASAVGAYMLAQCGSVAFAFKQGVVSGTALVFETWVLVSAYLMAIAVAVIAERRQRNDFRQERIIEQQKETISRERERSEELLKRELSHQVAERSRELGAALAKGDLASDAMHLVPGDRFAERYRVAPEAAHHVGSLDGSADVFALGIIAYEMLTGQNPFAMPPILLAMAQQPMPSPPALVDERLPASLRTLVAKCLSSDPSARPRARALFDAMLQPLSRLT